MLNESDLDAFGYYDMNKEGYAHKPHFTPMDMVRQFAKVTQQIPDKDLYETLIIEEFDEWNESILGAHELKELADLVYVIYGYANAVGYNLDEAIMRVHENNLGRIRQPDGTIKRRADGKIIKNPEYPQVWLDDLV